MKYRLFFAPAAIVVLIAFIAFCLSGSATRAAADTPAVEPVSGRPAAFAVSPKVSDLAHVKAERRSKPAVREVLSSVETPRRSTLEEKLPAAAELVTAKVSAVPMPTPLLAFDGLSNFDNLASYNALFLPPDMNGDIGPNHYVQAVNALVRIYDRSGAPVTVPFRMSQIFAPLNTVCAAHDDGLPIVQYDQLADRWLLSQYCNPFPPFRQMIAVSKTPDPTGEYYVWEYVMPNMRLNDFPKFGVWPDAYYMTTEEYIGSDFAGSGIFAFDRAKMLAGDPSASFIYLNRPDTGQRKRNLLPSDLDGLRAPPAGTPNVLVSYTADEYGDASDALRLYDLHVDFANPSATTFTERAESPLSVAPFDPTSLDGRYDVIQPAPGDRLDANSDRLNYRASYRQLASGASLVVNQTVRTAPGEPYRGGVRVYEVRKNAGAFAVTENSTVGDASSTRWIGSAATDHQGNIAVSYNFASEEKQPKVRYTGRLATEPAGTFRTEANLAEGTGVQRAFGWRWGDYSSLSVDPVDECTFWATGEYYTLASQEFSEFTWLTKIGAFKFDECTPAPRAAITGVVTDAVTGQPVPGALIQASEYSRRSAANGSYGPLTVIPGTYSVTASARGYLSRSLSVSAADGQVLALNFALQPVPVIETSGLSISSESCGLNGAPDPGETVSFSVTLRNNGALTTTSLVATLLNTGGVTNAGPPQSFGTIAPNASATRTFTFTVSSSLACGDVIAMTLQLADGATPLGQTVVPIQSGKLRVAFQQNFDRAMLAQLPPRWTREKTTDGSLFGTVTVAKAYSPAKSLFAPDPNQPGVSDLITPTFRIATASGRVAFRHLYDVETTFLRNRLYDGAVLEVKIGAAPWADIVAAGGAFETGGYDGALDACCSNPLAGRNAWSGRSGIDLTASWVPVSVRLPAAAAGQTVQLRWRMATDVGNSRVVEGEFIDDLVVLDGYVCSCGG